MSILDELVKDHHKIAIVGHVRPDGDCLGSITGTYRYLTENHPDLSVTAYSADVPEYLRFLLSDVSIRETDGAGERYDLVISVDASDRERIGAGSAAFSEASETLVIDHHETNPGFGDRNIIYPDASSTAEVLVGLMDPDRLSRSSATKLYTGIIQDTGVFRYSCTSADTLNAAAMLLGKGVDFSGIIEESVINQPYREMRIMGRVLEDSVLYADEQFIYGIAPTALQKEFGVTSHDLGNVVVELNAVKEANVALFLYQFEDGSWKGSLRAKCDVNVAKAASCFGGGGHKRAAGFSFEGDPAAVAETVRKRIGELRRAGNSDSE